MTVKPSDRKRLKVIVKDRNAAQKHAWRAEIVLLSGEGLGTNEIMRRTKKSKTCVWRWQEQFMEEGVAGLLRTRLRFTGLRPLIRQARSSICFATGDCGAISPII